MKSRMPEPSRVGHSTPVTVNVSPLLHASSSFASTWLGFSSCWPERSFGSVPMGLKERSDSTLTSEA